MNDIDYANLVKRLNENAKALQEFAFDYVAHQIDKHASVKYVVRWCGYNPAGDTFKRPENIT